MADPGISNPHGAGRHAPRRGPAVSRLAFGGAPIGNLYAGVDETIARLAVERAWQHGIRHFDTAPYYGYGLAEQRLGAALAGVPRASYTLSTKVGRLIEDAPGRDALADGFDVAGKRAVFDYSRDGVRRAVDASLRRLGVEHVDVLLLHDIGALTHGAGHPRILRQALDEALPALAELRAQGVCGAIGLGVNEEAVCLEVMPRFELDVIMLAGRYTLFEQEHGAQVMTEALQRGVSIFAAAPYNSGLLGGDQPGDTYNYAPADAAVRARAQRFYDVCAEAGASVGAAALQFPLFHPAVATVVCGMRTPAEADAAAARRDTALPEQLWPRLRAAGLLGEHAVTP
jgi:D-threo-aldose 1-dehydrogenase